MPPRIRPPGAGVDCGGGGVDLRIPVVGVAYGAFLYTSKTGSYYIRGGRRGGGEKQGQNM